MKIVIITLMFPPVWIGGTEIATQNIAKHLAQKGHQVHVITSQDRGLPKETQEDNFFIHRISYPKIAMLGYLIFCIKCFFLIRKIKPEVAHAQGIPMGFPSFMTKKFFSIPYMVYGRGSDVYLGWKFKKTISRIVLNSADAVVALTDDMKIQSQKNYKKNIIVVPNGVDILKFRGFSKLAIRKEFNIGFDQKIIVFIGGLKPVKGVKYLIEAFKMIHQKIPQTRMFLVGDGPERHNLEETVIKNNLEGKVTFTGQVKNEKIPTYLSIADIFVLPSLSEGFPSVILEAMACALPIVATKVGGIPEIIKEGENGFLVQPKNSEQIVNMVTLLLQDDILREKISQNNKEKVKEYSWEYVIGKLENIYSEIINKK